VIISVFCKVVLFLLPNPLVLMIYLILVWYFFIKKNRICFFFNLILTY
jgi:hypothetical protein